MWRWRCMGLLRPMTIQQVFDSYMANSYASKVSLQAFACVSDESEALYVYHEWLATSFTTISSERTNTTELAQDGRNGAARSSKRVRDLPLGPQHCTVAGILSTSAVPCGGTLQAKGHDEMSGRNARSRLLNFASANILPLIAVMIVATMQILAIFVKEVKGFVYSYLGTFTLGVLVTTAFGHVTTAAIRRGRHHLRVAKIYDTLESRVIKGESIDCIELREAFYKLPLLSSLQNIGWTTRVSVSPSECGIFVLGFQYYGHNIKISGFDSSGLTELAGRAAEDTSYRRVVLLHSLHEFVPQDDIVALASEIEAKAVVTFRVTSRFAEADTRLESQIQKAEHDHLVIISTTSQTSKFLLDILSRSNRTLSEISIGHLSPLVISHSAIKMQVIESSVPMAVIPMGQQIADEAVDTLRRSLRIITGVQKTWAGLDKPAIQLSTISFTTKHPGVKVRLLKRASYLQIFPGRLSYADNLYRFGYELTDPTLVRHLADLIDRWLVVNSEVCRDAWAVERLIHRTSKELARWLMAIPNIMEKLTMYHDQILGLLPEAEACTFTQATLDLLAIGMEAMESADINTPVNQFKVFIRPDGASHSDSNVIIYTDADKAHVSAGVVVRHADRVLVVKKVKTPNQGRWSIPAGHCEWGESALSAARRELREETGIESDELRLIYSGEINEGQPCRYGVPVHFWFLYCYNAQETPSVLLERTELEEFRWVDKSTLARLGRKTPAFNMLLQKIEFL